MKRLVAYLLIVLFLMPGIAYAKYRHVEAWYQNKAATIVGGITEYRPKQDNVRVDILTKDEAIEVDFARKWAESIGQALYYAVLTKRRPAVMIIVEEAKEWRYVRRVMGVRDGLWIDIKLYVITYKGIKIPEDMKGIYYLSIIHVTD